MGIEWPFRHLIALRPRELPILLKREFMHRRILSPAVELLHHPTQTAAPEHAIASAAPAASSKSRFRSLRSCECYGLVQHLISCFSTARTSIWFLTSRD